MQDIAFSYFWEEIKHVKEQNINAHKSWRYVDVLSEQYYLQFIASNRDIGLISVKWFFRTAHLN